MGLMKMILTTAEPGGTTEEEATEESPSFSGYDVTLVLMLVTAVVFNGVCIIAILRDRLHENDNRYIFMANLALSDLLMSVAFAVETLLTRIGNLGSDVTSNVVCIVANTFLEVTFPAELFSLLALTLDTFLHIELHMKYPVYVTSRVVYIELGLVVVLSLAQLAPFYKITSENGWGCVEHGTYPDWYNNYVTAVFFVAPFAFLLLLHARILYTAWKLERKVSAGVIPAVMEQNGPVVMVDSADVTNQTDYTTRSAARAARATNDNSDVTATSSRVAEHTPQADVKRRRDRRAFVTATVMLVAVLASWIPSYIILGILTEKPEAYDTPLVYNLLQLSILIFLCNTLVNPIIYIVRVPEVRKAIKRLFLSDS